MARQGYIPGGIGEAAHILRGKLSTAIQQGPTGRYFLVGSIPVALTESARHGTPQWPPLRVSMTWETLDAVIEALKGVGVTRFQLPDCSWYEEA